MPLNSFLKGMLDANRGKAVKHATDCADLLYLDKKSHDWFVKLILRLHTAVLEEGQRPLDEKDPQGLLISPIDLRLKTQSDLIVIHAALTLLNQAVADVVYTKQPTPTPTPKDN